MNELSDWINYFYCFDYYIEPFACSYFSKRCNNSTEKWYIRSIVNNCECFVFVVTHLLSVSCVRVGVGVVSMHPGFVHLESLVTDERVPARVTHELRRVLDADVAQVWRQLTEIIYKVINRAADKNILQISNALQGLEDYFSVDDNWPTYISINIIFLNYYF